MLILHFHLQPQFKNELFSYTSHHFTPHRRYELNKLTSLPMCGFIAQLVEQRTGNAEVTGSNPVEALIFFFRLLHSNNLLKLENLTAMIILHFHLQPQFKNELFSYTSHQKGKCSHVEKETKQELIFISYTKKEDHISLMTICNGISEIRMVKYTLHIKYSSSFGTWYL